MMISPLLIVNYISLLKISLIDRNSHLSQIDKAIKFKEFVHEQLDTSISTVELFALIYFTNQENKKVLKSSKKFSVQLHHIWNAANDLYAFHRVSYDLNQMPVFLTADNNLFEVFKRLKVRVALTDNGKLQGPFSATEVDYEKLNISDKDFKVYISAVERGQHIRKQNFYNSMSERLNGKKKKHDYNVLLAMIKRFELELNKYFD